MATLEYSRLTKIQKLAAFFILIGPDTATDLMKEFEAEELELICREMAEMHTIDENLQRELLKEFTEIITSSLNSRLGGREYAMEILSKAKGDFAAGTIFNRKDRGARDDGTESLRNIEGRQVLNLIRFEQPQTIAFVISCLEPSKASDLLMRLPPEIREEVLERLATMEPTSEDVVRKISQNLLRLLDRKVLEQNLHRSGGTQNVAEILNSLDRETRKELLSRIEERNAELGVAIRKKVFSFEDIARLDRMDIQRILREVDLADLAIALKPVRSSIVSVFMNAISKRAAESLRDDMDMMGHVKTRDIEAAQERIIQVVRRLEEAEEISLDSGDGNGF